ncbi:MAG: hypothetical protein NT105_23880 [Verrucomicrobia bacterium]|nr:hypothetical protein [Verrucomicrobiota bacterium]
MSDTTYKGKIGRLPRAMRDEVCRRMRDGDSDRRILVWLNADAEAKKRMETYFDGQPLNGSNMSEWRAAGYQDWKRQQDRDAQTEKLCKWAMNAVDGKPGDKASAIAAGQLCSALEDFDVEKLKDLLATDPSNHSEIIKSLARLRTSDASVKNAEVNAVKLQQAEEALRQANERLVMERGEFEIRYCQGVLKGIADAEAHRIAGLNISNDEKIALMRKHYFADVDALQKSGAVKLPD